MAQERNGWITGSEQEVVEKAAAFVTRATYRAVEARGRFTLVLAGGSTPRPLYELLARGIPESRLAEPGCNVPPDARRSPADPELVILPWRHTLLFQGDERYVPATHPDSNFRMARESLIRHIRIPPEHIVRMPVESGDAADDAQRYEALLRSLFRKPGECSKEGYPKFDLVMLGLGDDGHTASLFPGDRKALEETSRWVIAVDAPNGNPPGTRLTLTLPVINEAACVMFLVPAKRYHLALSIHKGLHPELPAGMVRPHQGRLHWFTGTARTAGC
ncbi:MAG: 6-phosphogluconolactonase [Chlorobiaceae bacterium]|nr:6-phosphogluconolactonase [Chlorobiaceae bacterium]